MSDRLRVIRDGYESGDQVLVIGRYGAKPRRARVTGVLRAACRLRYLDDNKEEVVMFKSLAKVEEAPEPQPTAALKSAVAKPPVLSTPPKAAPEPAPKPPADDIQAWFDMGRDIVSKMATEIAVLRETESALRADAQQLIDEADAARERADELSRRLKLVQSVSGKP